MNSVGVTQGIRKEAYVVGIEYERVFAKNPTKCQCTYA